MNKKIYLMLLCLGGALAFPSCTQKTTESANSTSTTSTTGVQSAKIKATISEKYPAATILDNEVKANGTEVDIKDGGKNKEVWFDKLDQWVSTHWDIKADEVPPAIMDYLTTSAYAAYKIDDIEVIENPQGLFYNFELTQDNNTVHLTLDQYGQVVESKQ